MPIAESARRAIVSVELCATRRTSASGSSSRSRSHRSMAERSCSGDDEHMRRFVDDDRGYLDWLDHHPDGFVINTERTPSAAYLMLHCAPCGTINGSPARGTTFTGDYIKLCGERDELEQFARHLGGHAQPCGLCLGQRGQSVPAKPARGKYGPLHEHLLGTTGTRVRMTFKEVEADRFRRHFYYAA